MLVLVLRLLLQRLWLRSEWRPTLLIEGVKSFSFSTLLVPSTVSVTFALLVTFAFSFAFSFYFRTPTVIGTVARFATVETVSLELSFSFSFAFPF